MKHKTIREMDRPMEQRKSARTRWFCRHGVGRIMLLAATLAALFALGSAEGYRFWSDGRIEGQRVVGAEYALRWSPQIWGPGDPLVFEVAPDPDFEVYFDSPAGVLPYVERALATWAEIPTASIAWRVDGVGDEPIDDNRLDERAHSGDGRNTIFVKAEDECGGRAYRWSERSASGEWRITQCDPTLCDFYAHLPEDITAEDLEEFREARRERAVYTLVHEIGHCLGLPHFGALSTTGRRTWNGVYSSLVHPRDPAMSYGYDLEQPADLSADDIVGASLLRPARGWERTTGSISGALSLADEPVPYAQVWALPVGKNPLEDRVGAFSDGDGKFLIEGLDPGYFALWAQPIAVFGAHPRLMGEDPPLELDETIFGPLVSVRAGQTSGDLDIPMRQGRAARMPRGPTTAKQDPKPPTSITGIWGSPCSGIRVRAEHPYAADGPLWFTRRHSFLRGDRWFGTMLNIELSPEAGAVVFDWVGSYRNWRWDSENEQAEIFQIEDGFSRGRVSYLDVSISDYRIERAGAVVRHSMEIAWPETTEATLRFRAEDDTCDGEPLVLCDLSGCEIRS